MIDENSKDLVLRTVKMIPSDPYTFLVLRLKIKIALFEETALVLSDLKETEERGIVRKLLKVEFKK